MTPAGLEPATSGLGSQCDGPPNVGDSLINQGETPDLPTSPRRVIRQLLTSKVTQKVTHLQRRSLSRGRLARSPVAGPAARYYRKLAWASADFARLADLAMVALGGGLKRKGAVTGRFADIFSWMYLGNAVLARFDAEGRREEDLPLLHWSMQYALARIQEGFEGLFQNLDIPVLGAVLRGPVATLSRLNPIGRQPADRLGSQVARILQTPGAQRDALTCGIHVPSDEAESLGRLERAFRASFEAEAVARKIKAAVRQGQLVKASPARLVTSAVSAGVISTDEAELVTVAVSARNDAVQVDSFTLSE